MTGAGGRGGDAGGGRGGGQALNGRHGQVDTEAAIGALHRSTADDSAYMDAEDDQALCAMLLQRTQHVAARPPPSPHTRPHAHTLPRWCASALLLCAWCMQSTCSHKASSSM